MEAGVPTRERLLCLVDDLELIARELIENSIAPKARKMSASEHAETTSLLIEKDKELRETLSLAKEQGQTEKKIQAMEEELKKHDDAIRDLQKKFKDAESLLSTAIFQAKQKLDSIKRADENPVNSEDLIKYAHRISSSNAVCAPLNWEQGDPRRPYPTDIDMRLGFLGKPEMNPPVGGSIIHQPARVLSEFSLAQGEPGVNPSRSPSTAYMVSPSSASSKMGQQHSMPPASHSQFSWQGGEMSMSMKDGSMVQIDVGSNRAGDFGISGAVGGAAGGGHSRSVAETGDEVDVMSTDSSSSSSTDSN